MSETPVYFTLAQLNSLMTASLRLALALLGLMLLVSCLSLRAVKWQPLAAYFSAWGALAAGVGLSAAGGLIALLPYHNPFVWQGLYLAGGLLPLAGGLCWLQSRRLWQRWPVRLVTALFGSLALAGVFWLPSFSRSDKTLFSTLLILPLAVALSYFPLLLMLGERPDLQRFARQFHLLWLYGLPIGLGLHYLWLYPILAGIPQQGEFYPYINLYDWFLFMAVILYSGNLYVDYWLNRQPSEAVPRPSLALSWNYLVAVTAVLSLWLNANIFDTLAL